MAIERFITCDDCGQSFWHKVERRSDPNPDECPLCHNQPDVVMKWPTKTLSPKIAKMVEEQRGPATSMLRAKATDGVYNQMVTSAAGRAEAAAHMMGVDSSETAHMRITDMKDNLKPGDIAAKIPSGPAALNANGPTYTQNPTAPGGASLPRGPMTREVSTVMSNITRNHSQTARSVVKAGETARYKGK